MKKLKQPFKLIYDSEIIDHIVYIERKYHKLIRETIKEQLTYEPDTESLNRKPLVRPTESEAKWELRFGPDNRFRVFYETDPTNREVNILAIGVKMRNKLFIAGMEYNL
ncbi:MAG: hypothetical protein BWK80_25805 [Desulfobacteraceae bacterium IS3]|nr:MAG: hypothetical protein BWK80_25805 [Desulfobacteraceae bacterium IS3]